MTLAPRQRQVLIFLAEGATREEIADTLGLSVHTVSTYIRNILSALDCHTRTEAVLKYYFSAAPQLDPPALGGWRK